jgi:hypothetical protein
MRRLLLATLVVVLNACSAAAQPASSSASPSSAHSHGYAYADVSQLVHRHAFYAAVLEYDRQIAALRSIRPVRAASDPSAARAEALRASSTVSGVAARSRAYAGIAKRMLDPTALESAIQQTYARQAAAVRTKAGSQQTQYRQALLAQAQNAISGLARSLEARTERAYEARAQELREREVTDQLNREKSVANRRLMLVVRLQNLRPQPVQRRAMQQQLDAIDDSLAKAFDSERRSDEATLTAFLANLRASAAQEFAQSASQLRKGAYENWQLRQRVTQAQLSEPPQLQLPPLAGGASPGSDVASTATQTKSALTSAGNDITNRIAAITSKDAAARNEAEREIRALEVARAALYNEIAAFVRRDAERVAASRGLLYTDRRMPGAVDITADVGNTIVQ